MKFNLFKNDSEPKENTSGIDGEQIVSAVEATDDGFNQTEDHQNFRSKTWRSLSKGFQPIDELISRIIPNENLAVSLMASEALESKKYDEELPHSTAMLLTPTISVMAKRKYFSHTFDLPTKSLNEARKMIKLQLEHVLPFPFQSAIIDVVKIDRSDFDSGLCSFIAFVTREKDIAYCRGQIEDNSDIEVFVAPHLGQDVYTWGVFRDRRAKRARAERRLPVFAGTIALALSSLVMTVILHNRQAEKEVLLVSAIGKAKGSLVQLRREIQVENAKLAVTTKGALEFGPDRALVGLSETSRRISADVKVQLIEIRNGKVRLAGHSPNPEASKQAILSGQQPNSTAPGQRPTQAEAPQIPNQTSVSSTLQSEAEQKNLQSATSLPFEVTFDIPVLKATETLTSNSAPIEVSISDRNTDASQKPKSLLSRLFKGKEQ